MHDDTTPRIPTLRERLADPHGYDTPLFPRAIAEMSEQEQREELEECLNALWINVWQTSCQMEEVQTRLLALEPIISAQLAQSNGAPKVASRGADD